jgi:fatty acid desaturase
VSDKDQSGIVAPDDGSADRVEARDVARTFNATLRVTPEADRSERAAGLRLAAEWFAILAVFYGLVYGVRLTWLKAVLLVPWSLYAGFALDNITHYVNHWPVFRRPAGNALWRLSGVLVFSNPLEIRAIHGEHHRAYSRADGRERPFGEADRGHSFWAYLAVGALEGLVLLWPLRKMEPCVSALAVRRPAEWREIVSMRWAFLVWFLLLVALDLRDTLVFLVPSVLVIGSFASLVMNLTDHIPGDARRPFRLATYVEFSNALEELVSAVNHQTCATHLTHHLFPGVHWVHLRALQRELAPIYLRNGTPRSLMVNTTLLGNPLRLITVLRELERRRFDGL